MAQNKRQVRRECTECGIWRALPWIPPIHWHPNSASAYEEYVIIAALRVVMLMPHRPKRYSPASARPAIAERVQSGLDLSDVAARVLNAIRENELYVFTHPECTIT
jgi:hypothetical protein